MSPAPMIPGGLTDQVARAGGEQAARRAMVALGGQDRQTCVYAVSRLLSSIALHMETPEEARELLDSITRDAMNEVELNWPSKARLFAEAAASMHSPPGHS